MKKTTSVKSKPFNAWMTFFVFAFPMFVGANASAQEVSLYPSGPTQDSSFVRFVDGTGHGAVVSSAAGRVALTEQQPSTSFLSVPAKWQVKGVLGSGSRQTQVSLQAQPGEFVSVVALIDAKGALSTQVLREKPDDFNALKASVGFVNLAGSACPDAGLVVAGSAVSMFQHVPAQQLQRRLVNPLKLSVQLACASKPVGGVLSLGQLEAGERYSVFALSEQRLVFVHDTLAH